MHYSVIWTFLISRIERKDAVYRWFSANQYCTYSQPTSAAKQNKTQKRWERNKNSRKWWCSFCWSIANTDVNIVLITPTIFPGYSSVCDNLQSIASLSPSTNSMDSLANDTAHTNTYLQEQQVTTKTQLHMAYATPIYGLWIWCSRAIIIIIITVCRVSIALAIEISKQNQKGRKMFAQFAGEFGNDGLVVMLPNMCNVSAIFSFSPLWVVLEKTIS